MVDISRKPATARTAEARGWIRMSADALDTLLAEGGRRKGDVAGVAELAGIQAGKRTGDLIPLCHVLPQVSLEVEVSPDRELRRFRAVAFARVQGSTGVEMEALTAVSVALLTVYDMAKALEKGMEIGGVRLVRKAGGRSGDWSASGPG
ncbi:MAG: cyclic pyranopterin monophosphate synthase MoaC [Acidobacteriota bacterium]